MKICCRLTVLTMIWGFVSGLGIMLEPLSRANARYMWSIYPYSYDDPKQDCFGFSRQYHKNGVCGEELDMPKLRKRMPDGCFDKGVIVRKYTIHDRVTISVYNGSRNGQFKLRICDDPYYVTQQCLDSNVLNLDGGKSTRYYTSIYGNEIYEMKYRLPEGLECEHCVMQLQYIARNCHVEEKAVGCGPQEEFRECADISIINPRATTHWPPPGGRPPSPRPENFPGATWYGLSVAVIALLVALTSLLGFYLYYNWKDTKNKTMLKSKVPASAPVPPPRHKRAPRSREQPSELELCKISTIAKSGFETLEEVI